MSKLLSVIIPTRNRQVYCIESVKSIMEDLDDRCEIVIQDNSDDGTLEQLVNNIGNSNIVYNYNATPLSFVDNFEKALELSNGKYFIVLGDDDSTTSDILMIVEWMEREGIESLSSSHVVDYIWPNTSIAKYRNGHLSIPNYKGRVENVDVEKGLEGLFRNGFLAYQSFQLPRTYHGIVRRESMNKVKELGGRYFAGLTPDIYSTVALACVVKRHVVIDYPFSIAGACPASATVHATVGGHSGYLEDAPHFNNRGDYDWEEIIPRYYSVETIWAETAIKAVKDMRYPNWEDKFDNYKLYIYGILLNRKFIFKLSLKETLKMYRNLNVSRVSFIMHLQKSFFKIFLNKFSLKKAMLNTVDMVNLENIADLHLASRKIDQFMLETKKPYA